MAWNAKLTRTLVLSDGRKLRTLREAADRLLEIFAGVRSSPPLEHAIELLLQAARTGNRADVRSATDQVALALRLRRLLEE